MLVVDLSSRDETALQGQQLLIAYCYYTALQQENQKREGAACLYTSCVGKVSHGSVSSLTLLDLSQNKGIRYLVGARLLDYVSLDELTLFLHNL
jgi:hypothetical protein